MMLKIATITPTDSGSNKPTKTNNNDGCNATSDNNYDGIGVTGMVGAGQAWSVLQISHY